MARGTPVRAVSTATAWGLGVHLPASLLARRALPMLVRTALALLCLALAIPVAAQASVSHGPMATRAELEAQADAATRAGRADEASELHRRLTEGDFAVGDRIVLLLQTDTLVHDTVVVREGQMLRIPRLPDVPLHGILRSELRDHVTKELSRVIRDPRVEVTPLLRLGIFGEVSRPGYYWTTADLLLSDAMMVAGGPTGQSDPSKTTVRRESRTALEASVVRTALARGATLDQLGLHVGDEIVVGKRSERGNTAQILQTTTVVLGLAISIYGLTRSRSH